MKRSFGGRRPRVLLINKAIPGANSSAGELRLLRMAEMLAARAVVEVVAAGAERPGDEAQRIRVLRRLGVRAPFGGGAVHLVRLLMGGRYDLIVAESWDVAEQALPLARRYQPRAVFVVDTIDLHFLRDARAGDLIGTRDPGHERSMARELDTYHRCDRRVFVSDVERRLYEALPGGRSDGNVVIPIIVARPVVARRPGPADVVFVGGLWHPPNLDGISWFCREVWPLVHGGIPGARLRLVGSNAWSLPIDTRRLAEGPGVVVEGFVEDLGDIYAEAGAVVAPLRFGAGMKGKVCEAMAAGVPVVTTTIGLEGIRALPGRDVLVADDAGSFASAVVSLLADGTMAASVGQAGAAAIQAQCGADVVRPAVLGLLGDLTSAPAGVGSERSGPPPLAPAGSASPAPVSLRQRGEHVLRWLAAAGWRLGRRAQALRQQGGR